MTDVLTVVEKPRFRGVLHHYACFVAIVAGVVLVLAAPAGARLAVGVFAVSLVGLLAVSALYHRVPWSPVAHERMRQADTAMIFVLIGGTFTPFAALGMHGAVRSIVLTGVWGGVVAMFAKALLWRGAPRWVNPLAGVVLGLVVFVGVTQLWASIGPVGIALAALGGAAYLVGAAAYTFKRPDPAPTVFGFHEVFHAATLVAAAAHYGAVWLLF
jgi:hemolysin III